MSSDEERRKALKPAVDLETAVAIAKEIWGLTLPTSTRNSPEKGRMSPKPLDSYDDNNFYMPGLLPDQTSPKKYLLKIHNGVESSNPEVLGFQNQMMATLHRAGIQCPLPVLIPSLPLDEQGEGDKQHSDMASPSSAIFHYQELPVRGEIGNARLAVRMLHWVEGTPLVAMPCTGQALVNAGAFLGRIDQVLDTFDHPGGHREHIWDLQRIRGLRPFVDYVQDPSRRALVSSILDAFETEVFPLAPSLRRGVLMSDFNDANIICDAQNAETIIGVIDFGDSVESWRVNDVAIAMAYAAVSAYGKSRPIQAAACLLKGFVQTYPLQPEESRLLLNLASARLAISVTLGAYSYQKDPTNQYLLIHSEPAWSALHTLWYSERAKVEGLFQKALTGAPLQEIEEAPFPLISKAP